jgi:hypothetical protein
MASKSGRLPANLAPILQAFVDHGIGQPICLDALRRQLPSSLGQQDDLPRRIRELRTWGYEIPFSKKINAYVLKSDKPTGIKRDTQAIPSRLAAQIRLNAHGTCQMCGRTIKEDGIRLDVDHRVPRHWGGQTEADNLWAICQECNISKQAFFATLPNSVMEKCMAPKEVWIRLGEALKAFEGRVCPRALLETVGQDDEWTRRLRELRDLGWIVRSVRDPDGKGRHAYAYTVLFWKPWPENVTVAIKAAQDSRNT